MEAASWVAERSVGGCWDWDWVGCWVWLSWWEGLEGPDMFVMFGGGKEGEGWPPGGVDGFEDGSG